jgi:hypothetical protein
MFACTRMDAKCGTHRNPSSRLPGPAPAPAPSPAEVPAPAFRPYAACDVRCVSKAACLPVCRLARPCPRLHVLGHFNLSYNTRWRDAAAAEAYAAVRRVGGSTGRFQLLPADADPP